MMTEVAATGVLINAAPVEQTSDGKTVPRIPESTSVDVVAKPLEAGHVYVVATPFVEFATDASRADRWQGTEYHGRSVPTDSDATITLLDIADEVDRIELLADLRIAGHKVSRWAYLSAPHRIDIDPELERQLQPLRSG